MLLYHSYTGILTWGVQATHTASRYQNGANYTKCRGEFAVLYSHCEHYAKLFLSSTTVNHFHWSDIELEVVNHT